MRYLSAYAKSQGVETELLFPLILGRGFEDLPRLKVEQQQAVLDFLRTHGVTHFGCYLMTGHLRAFKELVEFIRSRGWQGCIIAGGVHPTVCCEESLMDGVDYVVMGPGEKSLVDIVNGMGLSRISGLVYRENGRIKINQVAEDAYVDLNLLPFPDYDFKTHYVIRNKGIELLTIKVYRELETWKGIYYFLTTTRGCPYHCSYCVNLNRKHLQRASIDRVIEELHSAKKRMPFIKGCNIQDDSFFIGSDEWINEFCRRFKKEFNWPFIARVMPRFATDKRLRMMKESGLKYVSVGLQGSERMNREIYDRHETNKSFVDACHIMNKLGIHYVVDVILDNAYEAEEDLKEIARVLNSIPRPFKVLAYGMTPFPGTSFYQRVVRDGLLERFAADAYESMFTPTRPGAYETPTYWRLLISKVIPLYRNKVVNQLIESGPNNERAVHQLESICKNAERKIVLAEGLRRVWPEGFGFGLSFYKALMRWWTH